MRMLGAKVILTPAAERGTGMVRKAAELAEKNGWFLARQFENPANPAYHRSTTGPEIVADFVGKRLDFFVTGWGTGGTLTGAGEMIRLARPDVRIVVAEPEGAALLSGKPFAPHKIQGWTPDFVPAVLNRNVADRIVTVTRRRGDRQRARARAKRRHLRRHLERRHLRRGAQGGQAKPALARPCWPCCPTPASATCRPRCSKEFRMGPIRKAEARMVDASRTQPAAAHAGDTAPDSVALPDPFALYRGGVLHGGPHRL